MPPPPGRDVKLLVEEVVPKFTDAGYILEFRLEDGRVFRLYGIPPEVASGVNKMKEGYSYEIFANRESVFDALVDLKEFIKDLLDKIDRVVISELDYNTGLYTAEIEFNLGGIVLRKRMIPSHAIYLALLAGKPIYVSKRLVDEQEMYELEMLRLEEEEENEEEEEGEEGEEEFGP